MTSTSRKTVVKTLKDIAKGYGYRSSGEHSFVDKGNMGAFMVPSFREILYKSKIGPHVTLDCGFLHKGLVETFLGTYFFGKPGKLLESKHCISWKRVGFLMPEKADVWWSLADDDLSQTIPGLEKAFTEYIVPYVERECNEKCLTRNLASHFLERPTERVARFVQCLVKDTVPDLAAQLAKFVPGSALGEELQGLLAESKLS